jgi:hypothetical protein
VGNEGGVLVQSHTAKQGHGHSRLPHAMQDVAKQARTYSCQGFAECTHQPR